MKNLKQSFPYGPHTVTIEAGEIARQASGAVTVTMGDTVVLVTAVIARHADPKRDFFPLTVNYQERSYAAGKIPGGFFRREGRPSEGETLTSRLIDRPIRPLFPKGFYHESQVIATVMSIGEDIDPALPAMLGASAALALSGAPFAGPLGAAQVGYRDGEFLLNPGQQASDLNLMVAGTARAVLMVESEANILPEQVMIDAVMFGHQQMQVAINAINQLVADAGVEAMEWQPPATNQETLDWVANQAQADIESAYQTSDKQQRQMALKQIREQLLAQADEQQHSAEAVLSSVATLEKRWVRNSILDNKPRIDGRDTKTVRPIRIRTGLLPRAHGSTLFTRGETQAIVVTTLGTERDAQMVDAISGEYKEPFMLHYNFPPYCVGETGMVGSPKRREIGHGNLARRALQGVLPDMASYPYVLRIVSEITESNGSSSMATVCGASLSMMDAGVPLKSAVAGVAMGLIKEEDRFAVLTDILGDEDHLGDMDFKVAGTDQGITALQMDIKIDGITEEIMGQALEQAKAGRLHILGEMHKALDAPRSEMSSYAPRINTIRINPDKIRDVIGKGGANIRSITEQSGATIDISDDGTIKIASANQENSDKARELIERITADVEIGQVYEGPIVKVMDFGAFVNFLPGKDGMVHVSQICEERVEKAQDKLATGQVVKVKVIDVDRQGRVRLSMKAVS